VKIVDEFAKLIDSRINLKTKGQFMKTVPAVVTIGGTDTATVNILSENTTCELLNMTGTKLSVGDQVQVYSCGKTMYIGASRNIVDSGETYTAGQNIVISSSNVISSRRHMYGNTNSRLSGDATNGWTISWGGYATDEPPPTNCTGWIAKFGVSLHYGNINQRKYQDIVLVSKKYNDVFQTAYDTISPVLYCDSRGICDYSQADITATMSTDGIINVTILPMNCRQISQTGTIISYGVATDITLMLNGTSHIVYFN
jgi:hypothetical protein